MAKTISEIYSEYKIYERLQDHMYRVAGVVSMICDNINVAADKEKLVKTSLLHDMGNIVKANLSYFPDFTEEELKYWEGVKSEFVNKYGANDHEANANIAKEIGASDDIIQLIKENDFPLLCKHAEEENIYAKILIYADGRVSPDAVMSYDDRHAEARVRYPNYDAFQEESRIRFIACGKEIEKQIFSHCTIKPEDITDKAIAPIIAELKNFVVK